VNYFLPATHIALLRGINVGTAKRVPMADLRGLFEGLGYTGVATLLNSGNVVFSARSDAAEKLESRIEKAIEKRFGFTSRVTVITADELSTIVKENSLGEAADNHSRLLVAFLKTSGERAKLVPLSGREWKPGLLALGTRAAYLWCPDGLLESPLAAEMGRLLGDAVTTRNWATVLKLAALAAR
jgi:uncharacterized protein (DUF1697 family)